MIIQPFSSRFETPRVKLSDEAFENQGLNVFYKEKVPFADRTSKKFADNLINLLVLRVNQLEKSGIIFNDGIHIYELGAGTGILAKRILDLLKKNHLVLYRKIFIHASDISPTVISELKKLKTLRKHKGHVFFEVMDATKPEFKKKPFLIYFTDLLDALPCRHIRVTKGEIYEIQAQTFIEDTSQIIDAEAYPPKILNNDDILRLMHSKNVKKRLLLAPNLLKIFKEEHRLLPIDNITNMGEDERSHLKNLCRSFKNDRIFNYSYGAFLSVAESAAALKKSGFLVLSDFGTISHEPPKLSLWAEFGVTIFFLIDFYSIINSVEKLGLRTFLTSNTPGGPHELLLDTLIDEKKLEAKFNKSFGWNNQQMIEAFLEKIKKILQSEKRQEKYKLKRIHSLFKSLPPYIKKDYQILIDMALFLQNYGFNKQALKFAQILERTYEHTAGIYSKLIKGRVYKALGHYDLAELNYKRASEFNDPTAFYELAGLYQLKRQPADYIKAMLKYAQISAQNDILKSLFLISTAYERMADISSSKKILKQIVKLGPKINSLPAEEKKFLYEAKTLLKIFSQKSALDFKRDSYPFVWKKKSMVFLLGKQFTPWTPDGIKNPENTFIGGSEEAVIHLSEELTKLGWDITVYAEPQKKEGIYNGVRWLNYYHFNPKDKFNILILWRHPQIIDLSCQAKKLYFWSHDADLELFLSEERLKKIDKVIVLSKAHKKTFSKLGQNKFFITGNGFYEYLPKLKPDNNPHWCIWTSSYERGLEHLLKIWPDVKKAVPDAKLHVFYGWQLFDMRLKNEPHLLSWKKPMESLMKQPGIIDHGRKPQKEIEKWYKKCGIFAYPSHFYEISCISAMKAQAFGAIPIVTSFAALNETVRYGKKIKGDIYRKNVLNQYKKKLIKALKDSQWQEEERKKMIPWAKDKFSWKKIARQWTDEFKLF